MKKSSRIIFAAISLLIAASSLSAQEQSTRESLKERQEIARIAKSELSARASKEAKKAAKSYTKEGWQVAVGHLPLEKMLDKSYVMYYEYEDSGLPKFIMGDAMSVGQTYDAAKAQAIELAKVQLAGLIQTDVTALVESTVSNSQISADDAVSITEAVQASKNLISQKLGRVVPVVECYRLTPKRTYEVRVTIAYNQKMALDQTKEIVRQKLEEKGKDLHNQLDAALGF